MCLIRLVNLAVLVEYNLNFHKEGQSNNNSEGISIDMFNFLHFLS